ncbi:MAG: hypothetical protein A4E27_00666 [Methanobacterium sp. PtaU1.Bin242]|nr:MAG: hypothetical protein A4E27_00666 [Methanobacterium sp. PtaU1.Bin242]
MDVGMITIQYLNGEQETFEISTANVDQIKVMEDRIIICFNKDPSANKNKCKIIIIDNISSFDISPCDVQSLVASSGKK